MNQSTTSATGTTTRTRRRRGSLGREVILDAAEAVASDGFDTLSMRAVAGHLGAVPMALYNHFGTKDEMVDALLDRVLGRFEPPPASEDWIEDLRRFAHAHRRVLEDHPWAVAPLFGRPNPGLSSVRIGEVALEVLRRGGLTGADAVAIFSGVVALNYGWASFTAARALDPAGRGTLVSRALADLPAEQFPLTTEVAAALGSYGSPEHYDLVLDRLLLGLRTTNPPA